MKWEDISQRLPGRSAISCRLHYQNYLERRCDWSDEKKSKLARLYERYVNKHLTPASGGLQCVQHYSTYMTDRADKYLMLDLSLICGKRLQRKWASHGVPPKPCTGN